MSSHSRQALQICFAIVLLHEITHAVFGRSFSVAKPEEIADGTYRWVNEPEFARCDTESELGHTWETWAFGMVRHTSIQGDGIPANCFIRANNEFSLGMARPATSDEGRKDSHTKASMVYSNAKISV